MRLRALTLILLTFAISGCLTDRPAKSTSLIDRFRSIGGPSGPDAVFIEYALIERPAGNSAIDREVWSNIDETILPSETRALLSENGLRVGTIGGLLPSELEAMIVKPMSATGHRQRRLYVGKSAGLLLNGPLPQAEFQVRRTLGDEPTAATFESAKLSLNFTPTFSNDGRIMLRCVPEIEHQDKKNWLPTGAAGPGWGGNKPVESYESLAWEATVSSREFIVIGTQQSGSNGLGQQLFLGTQGNDKVQRLLVIRAGRLTPADTGWEPSAAVPSKDGIVPIAAQASVSAARGQKP